MSGLRLPRSHAPRLPLGPHLASPNRVLAGGACAAQPLLSAGRARLRYDFALRSEAIGCSCAPPSGPGSCPRALHLLSTAKVRGPSRVCAAPPHFVSAGPLSRVTRRANLECRRMTITFFGYGVNLTEGISLGLNRWNGAFPLHSYFLFRALSAWSAILRRVPREISGWLGTTTLPPAGAFMMM